MPVRTPQVPVSSSLIHGNILKGAFDDRAIEHIAVVVVQCRYVNGETHWSTHPQGSAGSHVGRIECGWVFGRGKSERMLYRNASLLMARSPAKAIPGFRFDRDLRQHSQRVLWQTLPSLARRNTSGSDARRLRQAAPTRYARPGGLRCYRHKHKPQPDDRQHWPSPSTCCCRSAALHRC